MHFLSFRSKVLSFAEKIIRSMSTFGIFAFVLTVIYIFYYGIMFAYDQYGIRRSKDTSDVEDIDVGSQGGDSRFVREVGDGTFTLESSGEEGLRRDVAEDYDTDEDNDYQFADGYTDDLSGAAADDDLSAVPAEAPGEDPGEDPAEDPVEDPVVDRGGVVLDSVRLLAVKEKLSGIIPSYGEEHGSMQMLSVLGRPHAYQSRIRTERLKY